MLCLRADGKIGNNAACIRELAQPLNLSFPLCLSDFIAAREIAQFHKDNLAVLSVGSPSGSLFRTAEGNYVQPHTFGSIIKPRGETPRLGDRYVVSIEIAAIKCFATDDPGGTDEPYLITCVYALDPSRKVDELVDTRRIDHSALGDADTGRVFAQARPIAANVVVPGEGEIRMNVQLWDEEMVGSTKNLKDATATAAKVAVTTGLTAAGAALGGAAGGVGAVPGAIAGAALGQLLDPVSEAIGGLVADLLAGAIEDDLVDQLDFVIPSTFLHKLCFGDPEVLNRTSTSIPGVTYNFPETPEDESDAGKSWLFERGHGTYRVFFKITRIVNP